MKAASITFLAGLFFALNTRADLTLVQKVEGAGPEANTMTIKIKGDKVRLDVTPEVSTILDSKTGEMLNLMNDQKKFLRISAARLGALANTTLAAGEKDQSKEKAQLKPTGQKEMINGYETDEYTCDAFGLNSTYWIAPKYPNSATIMKQLQSLTPQAWNIAAKEIPDYRDFPGLPIRSRVVVGEKEITSTLASINEAPLSDAEFEPPKGFTEIKMPDLGALLGRKNKAVKPAPAPR